MITLTLPFPPSLNHYYRRVGLKTLISREGRAYRRTVGSILADRGVKPLDGPACVRIEVYPPDRRRRDLDNLLKGLGDSLEHGGAFHDDSQIVWLLIEKAHVVPGGKVIVELWPRSETPNSTEKLPWNRLN